MSKSAQLNGYDINANKNQHVTLDANRLRTYDVGVETKLTAMNTTLDSILVDSDAIDSSLNTIEANSTLQASRLNNIQNWVGTADGAGGGDKSGVMLKSIETTLDAILVDSDAIDSSLNTIEANSTLQASRLNNIQNWIGTADGAGGGDKLGVVMSNILTKNTEIDTVLDAIKGDTNKLSSIDSNLNVLKGNQQGENGISWLSSATIADGSLSSEISVDKFTQVRIYGTQSGSASSQKIWGSNTSGGTFYVLDSSSNAVQTTISGVYYLNALIQQPPKYIKIGNDSGGSLDFTLYLSYANV